VTKDFYTIADNQTSVNCKITQSDDPTDDPKWVRVIWDGELELPAGRKKGQKIDITYSYDDNGTMHASFLDVASGKITEGTPTITPTVSEQSDIDAFIVD
jgi:molecular chaperone DnaK